MSTEKNMVIASDNMAVVEQESEGGQSVDIVENSRDVYTHKFKAPFSYEGKTYEELCFDFGRLTGRDGAAIENEIQISGRPVIVPSLSGEYLMRMAARACTTRIGFDVLKAIPLSDYNRIRSAARNFLTGAAL